MFFFYFKVCAYQKYKLPPRADGTIVFFMQNTRLYSLVFCMKNTIVPSARGGSLYFWYAHTLK